MQLDDLEQAVGTAHEGAPDTRLSAGPCYGGGLMHGEASDVQPCFRRGPRP